MEKVEYLLYGYFYTECLILWLFCSWGSELMYWNDDFIVVFINLSDKGRGNNSC